MHAFLLGTRLNMNVNSGTVLLGHDLDIGAVDTVCQFAIGTDVISSLRHFMEVCYLL